MLWINLQFSHRSRNFEKRSGNFRENQRNLLKKFSVILTKLLGNSYKYFNTGENIFGVTKKFSQTFSFLNFMRHFERLKKKIWENLRNFLKNFQAISTKFMRNSYNFKPGKNIFRVPRKFSQIFWLLNFIKIL